MEVKVKVKSWGSSFGVVIPSEVIKGENIHNGEEIFITVRKKKSLRDIFGSLKDWKIDPQKFKNELREDWNR